MPAIQTTNLTKEYGDVVAVDGLDLTVEEGEIFGFLGPNGAGKSTTINVLLDFIRPTAGEARVLGHDAQHEVRAIRERLGVLPEGYDVYDRLTGRRHVELAIDLKESGDDPDAILDRVGLEPSARDRKAGGYSQGMRQRLALGMALVGDPDLLILDEPTNGLDPNGARELREVVRNQAERGATVFFSSHILEQVQAVCDRVGILNEGQLVALDTIEGLRREMGTGSTLILDLDRFPDGTDLEAIDGVSGVVREDGSLHVSCTEPAAKLATLDRVREAGARVEDFRTSETSLEELFASYTQQEVPA